ncbi:hypothetical protein AB4175_24040 [Vibrio cyclitrophicus]
MFTKTTLVLSSFCLATLLSSAVQASGGSFELPTDMLFTGTVIDTAPNWQWEVHSEAQAWAQGWDADISDGIKDGNIIRFTYPSKNAEGRNAFVQGMMSSTASSGRSDILPQVSITDAQGQRVLLNGDTIKQAVTIDATGLLPGGATVPGTLSLSIESAYTVTYKRHSDITNYYSESYNGDIGWAAASVVINNLPEDYTFNGDGVKMRAQYARFASGYSIASVIKGDAGPSDMYDVVGGFSSHLSEISTSWTTVPNTWTATLTAQIEIP